MSNTVKAKPAARAKAKTPKNVTTSQKVAFTRSSKATFQASTLWPTSPQLQGAVDSWTKSADAIDATSTLIVQLRDQLKTAMLTLRSQKQNWGAETKHVFSVIDLLCGGDAGKYHELGLEAVVPGAYGSAQPVPTEITSRLGKLSGEAVITWNPHAASRGRGFLVQHATDVASPATYSSPSACMRRRYDLTGASPASVVHVRVAAIDPSSPTGQTAWSEWIAVTTR